MARRPDVSEQLRARDALQAADGARIRPALRRRWQPRQRRWRARAAAHARMAVGDDVVDVRVDPRQLVVGLQAHVAALDLHEVGRDV